MKKIKLKVIYDTPLNMDLDAAIEKTLKEFGFKRWASGYDMEDHVRDLAFEKETKD